MYNSLEVRMHHCHCATCGVPFGLPLDLVEARQKSSKGRPIMCPNGHQNYFNKANAINDSSAERLNEIHRAEQMEAKIADLEAQLSGTPRPEPTIESEPVAAPATPRRRKAPFTPLPCPHCGKQYKLPQCLKDHVRDCSKEKSMSGKGAA